MEHIIFVNLSEGLNIVSNPLCAQNLWNSK